MSTNTSNATSCRVKSKICIIVAGMHRSGTSATTRVINLLGADITHNLMTPVAEVNDRGFWESRAVADIHDRLLRALDRSYDDPLPLPKFWLETTAAVTAKRELAEEIDKDFNKSRLFVVKDPRIARLLPLWLLVLDERAIEPVVAIPVRNPLEVAASLNKRDGTSLAQALVVYLWSYLDVEAASRERKRFFIRYDSLLKDWRILARKLEGSVNPSLLKRSVDVEDAINNFLIGDLHRYRATRDDLVNAPYVPDAVVEVFDCMSDMTDNGDESVLRLTFDGLRARVSEATKLFEGIVVGDRTKLHVEVDRVKNEYENIVAALKQRIGTMQSQAMKAEETLHSRVAALEALLQTRLQEARRQLGWK